MTSPTMSKFISVTFATTMAESRRGDASASPTGPVKGILKKGGGKAKKGVGIAVAEDSAKTGAIQWDEMNILMTEHPEGKDYGHMKINEPKTPYSKQEDSGDEGDKTETFTDDLTQRVMEAAGKPRSKRWEGESSGSDLDPDELLSEEQKEHKKKFREWRKNHYDEFHAVKRAREQRKGRRGDSKQQAVEDEDEEEGMDTEPQSKNT